jgi:uncharacterized protein (DUF1786 family)
MKTFIPVETTIRQFTEYIKNGVKVKLNEQDAKTLIDYIEEFEDFKIVYETFKGKTTIQKF